MKIKHQVIRETLKLKVNGDWNIFFIDHSHRWHPLNYNQIHHRSPLHSLITWVLTNLLIPILVGIVVNIAWSAIGQTLSPANVYEKQHFSPYIIELSQSIAASKTCFDCHTVDVPYTSVRSLQCQMCQQTIYLKNRTSSDKYIFSLLKSCFSTY